MRKVWQEAQLEDAIKGTIRGDNPRAQFEDSIKGAIVGDKEGG